MPKSSPWYPAKELTFGSLYFYIKQKTHSLNAFDSKSIAEAKHLILKEARTAAPSYKDFLKAAMMATNLSERTIKTILYSKEHHVE